MKCRECEERIAGALRPVKPGTLPMAALAHLARCAACREYREDLRVAAGALAMWEAPRPDLGRRTRMAEMLVARFATADAAVRHAAEPAARRARLARLLHHPALIGLLGAAASAAGVAFGPGWLQQIAAGWAAIAAVLASLVLLIHGRPALLTGERL